MVVLFDLHPFPAWLQASRGGPLGCRLPEVALFTEKSQNFSETPRTHELMASPRKPTRAYVESLNFSEDAAFGEADFRFLAGALYGNKLSSGGAPAPAHHAGAHHAGGHQRANIGGGPHGTSAASPSVYSERPVSPADHQHHVARRRAASPADHQHHVAVGHLCGPDKRVMYKNCGTDNSWTGGAQFCQRVGVFVSAMFYLASWRSGRTYS